MSRPKIFGWGEWQFEPLEYRLTRNDEQITLPMKTLDLLALLISKAPRLVTKADILNAVWADAAVEEGNIAFHVAALRKALDVEGESTCIETVRGKGYRFVAPVTARLVVIPTSTAMLQLPASVIALEPAIKPAAQPVARRSGLRRTALWVLIGIAAGGLALAAYRTGRTEPVLITPFVVLSNEPDIENLGDSLAQFVVTALAETGVPAITRDGGPEGETPRAAAARLGSTDLLTGDMTFTSENRWQVSVQLVRAEDGVAEWSWRFLAPYNEHRHQLQEQISKRVAEGLKLRLLELQQH